MSHQKLLLQIVSSILVVLLVGCGGTPIPPTVTPTPIPPTATPTPLPTSTPPMMKVLSDFPVYPGATPYKKGNSGVDNYVELTKGFWELFSGFKEIEFYELPEDTTAQDILDFYRSEMPRLGWEETGTTKGDEETDGMWWERDDLTFGVKFEEEPASFSPPYLYHLLRSQ